jgi:amidohydrolase
VNVLDNWLAAHTDDLIAIRRDLHAHPEIAFEEHRTSALIADRLRTMGLQPILPACATGVLCDIGAEGPVIALRADIDALPIDDAKDVPYRSTVSGVCHACGHDAHTTILLGAAAVLSRMDLPGRIRLIFQPAEERLPGGAPNIIAAGGMKDVEAIYAVHCDPRVDVGRIGLRVGSITAACDMLDLVLSGNGGHTGRPQLTVDIVYALGRLITDLPGLLSRRVDPRAALSLVWGTVQAGNAPNAIPREGRARGTLRMLDHGVWDGAEPLVRGLVDEIVRPTGARATISYERGVPPVVNDASAVEVQRAAVLAAFGAEALDETVQSMGGEDFAWYLEHAPGALARLGVRPPGATGSLDLHQSTFDIDESVLAVGVRFMVHTALAALA